MRPSICSMRSLCITTKQLAHSAPVAIIVYTTTLILPTRQPIKRCLKHTQQWLRMMQHHPSICPFPNVAGLLMQLPL
jgi:hypothetical protein